MITLRTVLPDGNRGENYKTPICNSITWGGVIYLSGIRYRVDYIKWQDFEDAQGVLHLMDEESYDIVVAKRKQMRLKNKLFWFAVGALISAAGFLIWN